MGDRRTTAPLIPDDDPSTIPPNKDPRPTWHGRTFYKPQDHPFDWKNEMKEIGRMGLDIGENVLGIPEAALTMFTGLVGQSGTALGTGAGMIRDALRSVKAGVNMNTGDPYLSFNLPDWRAATETIEEFSPRVTYEPRSEGGKNVLRGLGAVTSPLETGMRAVSDPMAEVYGPGAGALTYAALNLVGGPEEAAGLGAAIKGSRSYNQLVNVLRKRGKTGEPNVFSGPNKHQRGAWVPMDIEGTEGDFSFRSPTVDAFSRLKKQEQTKLPGRQLLKALMREGAKKDELAIMGLANVLDTDEVLNVADVLQIAKNNIPSIEFSQVRAGPKLPPTEETINETIDSYTDSSSSLEYPQVMYEAVPGRYGRRKTQHFNTADEAEQFLATQRTEEMDRIEQEIRDNLSQHFTAEALAEMTPEQLDDAIASQANEAAMENINDRFYYETDYNATPLNRDEVREEIARRVRDRPEDFGLYPRSAHPLPEHSEYTVGGEGRVPEANYTVGFARSLTDPSTGRGMRTPEFLRPYVEGTPEASGQIPLLPDPGAQSAAFKREALRRQQVNADPNARMFQTAEGYQPGVHYPASQVGDRQIAFVRETDQPPPEWGTVQQGVGRVDPNAPNMRLAGEEGATETPTPQSASLNRPVHRVEEVQSDLYQLGRKRGMANPKGVEQRKEDIGKITEKNTANRQANIDTIEKLLADPEVQKSIADYDASRSFALFDSFNSYLPGGARFEGLTPEQATKMRAGAGVDALRALRRHVLPGDPGYEAIVAARDAVDARGGEIPDIKVEGYKGGHSDRDKGLTMSGPFSETEQYTKLMLADALRRAVQEGKQYFEWTEPTVHSARWGTETIQFAPMEGSPRKILYTDRQPSSTNRREMSTTMGEALQARADELLKPGAQDIVEDVKVLDLDDPDIDKKLVQLVKSELSHGATDYPSSQLFFEERAAMIKQQLELAAKKAESGTREAAHFSPRERGFNMAIGPWQKYIEQVLRTSGAKMPPVHKRGDMPSQATSLFEIDPDIARAAKRGFKLPH